MFRTGLPHREIELARRREISSSCDQPTFIHQIRLGATSWPYSIYNTVLSPKPFA